MPKIKKYIPFLILFLAFLLRLHHWFDFFNYDENVVLGMANSLFREPFPTAWPELPGYPPFFNYLLFFISLGLRPLLSHLGVFPFFSDLVHTDAGATVMLLAGRLLVALCGTAIVYFAYRIGKTYFNEKTGWLAGLLMAVNTYHVYNSHVVKADIPQALLMLVMLFFCLRLAESGNLKFLFWGAFFLGLAVATKYYGVVELPVLVLALFLSRPAWNLRFCGSAFWRLALGGLAGFFIGAPNWLVHPWYSIVNAYQFASGMYGDSNFYGQEQIAYLQYLSNTVEHFGLLLSLVCLLGLGLVFFHRTRAGWLLFSYIAIYYVIFGKSYFFGERMSLPLSAVLAVIIAKTICWDIPAWRLRFPWAPKALAGILGAWGLVFCGLQLSAHIHFFHIVSKTTKWEQARSFRQYHIPPGYRVGREFLTPRFPGDEGKRDLNYLDLKEFQGDDAFHFLMTSQRGEFILHESRDEAARRDMEAKLQAYRPFFHTVNPVVQTSHNHVKFWYRIHPQLAALAPGHAAVPELPRLFFRNTADNTIYLPLQTYEKNPCWGETQAGVFHRWLYSKREIRGLRLYLFSDDGDCSVTMRAGGRTLRDVAVSSGKMRRVEIGKLRTALIADDWIYELDVVSEPWEGRLQVAFLPIYAGTEPEAPLPSAGAEEIPPLFTKEPCPEWVQDVYRRCGLDLQLLQFIHTAILWDNTIQSLAAPVVAPQPLGRGVYLVRIFTQPMLPGQPVGRPLHVEWSLSGQATRRNALDLDVSRGGNVFLVQVDEPLMFLRIRFTAPREGNIYIERMQIEADYRRFLPPR